MNHTTHDQSKAGTAQAQTQLPSPAVSPQGEGKDLQLPAGGPQTSAVRRRKDPEPSVQSAQPGIQNPKRPYEKTPARRAASLANLQKARAVPKEKIYQLTEKRKAANRANLAIANARRRQQREQIVNGLNVAFPPLSQSTAGCGTGVDRNARGDAELEKTARGILSHRWALQREARREGAK